MINDDPGLEMDFTLESDKGGVIEDSIFQVLMLGDWTADGSRHDLDHRKTIEIDRDNFDDVMHGLGVRLDLELDGAKVALEFNSLDDFHPDELFRRVPQFFELRDLRKRLRNSDTFNSAAREVRDWASIEGQPRPNEPVDSVPPVSDNLLDAILTQPEGGAAAPKGAVSSDISRLVSELVRPHLVTVEEDEQAGYIAAVDQATSALMRSILHDKRFQQLEAAWRGLFLLVRRAETASDLRVYIFDVSKRELCNDVKSGGESQFGKLSAAGRNDEPWAAVLGNYAFEANVDDVAALIRTGKLSGATKTPFISHIRPDVIGVRSLADHPDPDDWDFSGTSDAGKLWTALRDQPQSQYIGLTMPRFLVRLPYGSDTEPSEAFSFEEVTEAFTHDDYVWANGCFAVAILLAHSYTEFAWDFGQRFIQDIDGMPLHMYKKDGEAVYQSCAEVQLSQNAAEKLVEYGLMPLVSFKNMDRIRLVRFQSIAAGELKGRWK